MSATYLKKTEMYVFTAISQRTIYSSLSCQELLRAFMRVRSRTELPQGLILDSTVPELAPHIIISPPSDSPFEVYCPCGACDRDWPYVPPQHTDSLIVPGQQWYYSAHEEQDVSYDQIEIPTETSHQLEESSNDIDAPHVFSHSWFRQYVSTTYCHPISCKVLIRYRRLRKQKRSVSSSIMSFRRSTDGTSNLL